MKYNAKITKAGELVETILQGDPQPTMDRIHVALDNGCDVDLVVTNPCVPEQTKHEEEAGKFLRLLLDID